MAYYELEAEKGFLAALKSEGPGSKVPSPADLVEAASWADAEVNQFLIQMVGAANAQAVITAFLADPPPEIKSIAYLYGCAWIYDRRAVREWGRTKGKKTEGERLRELAKAIEDRIRRTGYVTTSSGALYALAGKRKRGIVVEDPGVRVYGVRDEEVFHGQTSRHNLETLFREANIPAPSL